MADIVAEAAAWRPSNPAAAVGLSVEYLMNKPAFASLPFGDWSRTLFFQVVREHYLFFVDQQNHICGFLGWALTDEARAALWLEGRAGLGNDDCWKGDCVIVNAWAADSPRVNAIMRDTATKLFGGHSALYFKRRNPAGRERGARLAVPKFRRRGQESR